MNNIRNMFSKHSKPESYGQDRISILLRPMLATAFIVSLLASFILAPYSNNPIITTTHFMGVALLFLLLIVFANSRYAKVSPNRTRFISILFMLIAWSAITHVVFTQDGGLNSPLLGMYILVIVAAGLLLGNKEGYFFASLSLIVVMALYAYNSLEWTSVRFTPENLELSTVLNLVNFLVSFVLIYLTNKNIERENARTRARERELAEKNEQLRAIQDTLERRVVERSAQILEKSQYFQALVENSPISVASLDMDNRIIDCNPAFESLFQYTQAEIIGRRLDKLITNENTQAEAERCTQSVIQGETTHYKSVRFRKDGSPVNVEIFGVPVMVEERQIGVLVLYHDITERLRVEEFLQHVASHDPLTGLPNRSLFYDRLNHALQKAARFHGELAVAFLDLDGFKSVNDTFGHEKGDSILKDVADRLKTGVRASDTIARLGGDEFTFIFENIINIEDIDSVVRKILGALAEPFELDGEQMFITASLGISLYPHDGDDSITLLRKADEAMYSSKDAGCNRYKFASEHYKQGSILIQKESILKKRE